MYIHSCISLLPLNKQEKQKQQRPRGEKEKEKNEVQGRNQYQNQQWGNPRQKIMSSLLLFPQKNKHNIMLNQSLNIKFSTLNPELTYINDKN